MDNCKHHQLFTNYIANRTDGTGTLAIVRKECALPGDVSDRRYFHVNQPTMPVSCNNDCGNCTMNADNQKAQFLETHTHIWTCIKQYHQPSYTFETEQALFDNQILHLYEPHLEHLVQNFYAAVQETAYPELAAAEGLDLPVRLTVKDHAVFLDAPSYNFRHSFRLALEVQLRSELEKDFEEELVVHKLTT